MVNEALMVNERFMVNSALPPLPHARRRTKENGGS